MCQFRGNWAKSGCETCLSETISRFKICISLVTLTLCALPGSIIPFPQTLIKCNLKQMYQYSCFGLWFSYSTEFVPTQESSKRGAKRVREKCSLLNKKVHLAISDMEKVTSVGFMRHIFGTDKQRMWERLICYLALGTDSPGVVLTQEIRSA